MKTKFGLGLLAGALFLCASLGAANLPQLRPENKNALGKLIGPNFLQKGTKVPRVLVFYRCEGFCHGDAIVTANEAFRLAAARTGAFTVKFSEDYEDLKAANLANFDVLVMNNTTNLKVKEHPYLADSLSTFTASGKGYVALHAGVDNFADCLILADMTSGLFAGHPWGAGGTWSFKLDDPKNPVNAAFAAEPNFKCSDEIYQSRAPAFNPAKIHSLVSLDFSDPAVANREGKNRPDSTFYPVSWLKPYGKGRVFYTSFGHDARAWVDPKRLRHMFDGYLYCAGQLACDDTPAGFDLSVVKQAKTFSEAEMIVREMLAHAGSEALVTDTVKKAVAVLKDPSVSAEIKDGVKKALRGFGAPTPKMAYAGTAGASPEMQKVAAAIASLLKKPADFTTLFKGADEVVQQALVKNADAVAAKDLVAVYAGATTRGKAAIRTRLAAKRAPACTALAAAALADESDDLASAAASALRFVGTAAEIPALLKATKRGGQTAPEAEYAIQAMADPAATAALAKLAATEEGDVFKLLSRRADSKQLGLWTPFVKSEKVDVRKSAWRALSRQLTEKNLAPALAWLADDFGAGEVTAATSALRAATKNAEQADLDVALAKAWKTASTPARRVLGAIIGLHPSAALAATLKSGLTDADKDVRVASADALGSVPDAALVDVLMKAYVAESDAQVKEAELASAFKVAGAASADLRAAGIKLFKLADEADRTNVARFILRSSGLAGFDDIQSLFGDAKYGASAKTAFLKMFEEISSGTAQADMSKPISSEKWTAKASCNENGVKRAFDGNAGTRWDTGREPHDGDWFALGLGANTFISELTLDTKNSNRDTLPRGEVYVSNDGEIWSGPVLTFGEEVSKDGVTVLPVNAAGKWVKVVAKGKRNGLYWSIHEIQVKSGIGKDALDKLTKIAEGLKK